MSEKKYTDAQLDELVSRACGIQPRQYSIVKISAAAEEKKPDCFDAGDFRTAEHSEVGRGRRTLFICAGLAACVAVVIGAGLAADYLGVININPFDTTTTATIVSAEDDRTTPPNDDASNDADTLFELEEVGFDYSVNRADTLTTKNGTEVDLTLRPARAGDTVFSRTVTADGEQYELSLIIGRDRFISGYEKWTTCSIGDFVWRLSKDGEIVDDALFLENNTGSDRQLLVFDRTADGYRLKSDYTQIADMNYTFTENGAEYPLIGLMYTKPFGEGDYGYRGELSVATGEECAFITIKNGKIVRLTDGFVFDSAFEKTGGNKFEAIYYDNGAIDKYTLRFSSEGDCNIEIEVSGYSADEFNSAWFRPTVIGCDYSLYKTDSWSGVDEYGGEKIYDISDRYAHSGDILRSWELDVSGVNYELLLIMSEESYSYGTPEDEFAIMGGYMWRLVRDGIVVDDVRLSTSVAGNNGTKVKVNEYGRILDDYFIFDKSGFTLTDESGEYPLVIFTYPAYEDKYVSTLLFVKDNEIVLVADGKEINGSLTSAGENKFCYAAYSDDELVNFAFEIDVASGKLTEAESGDYTSDIAEKVFDEYNAAFADETTSEQPIYSIDLLNRYFYGVWTGTNGISKALYERGDDFLTVTNINGISESENYAFLTGISGGEGYMLAVDKNSPTFLYYFCGIAFRTDGGYYSASPSEVYNRTGTINVKQSQELPLSKLGAYVISERYGFDVGQLFTLDYTDDEGNTYIRDMGYAMAPEYPIYVDSVSYDKKTIELRTNAISDSGMVVELRFKLIKDARSGEWSREIAPPSDYGRSTFYQVVVKPYLKSYSTNIGKFDTTLLEKYFYAGWSDGQGSDAEGYGDLSGYEYYLSYGRACSLTGGAVTSLYEFNGTVFLTGGGSDRESTLLAVAEDNPDTIYIGIIIDDFGEPTFMHTATLKRTYDMDGTGETGRINKLGLLEISSEYGIDYLMLSEIICTDADGVVWTQDLDVDAYVTERSDSRLVLKVTLKHEDNYKDINCIFEKRDGVWQITEKKTGD